MKKIISAIGLLSALAVSSAFALPGDGVVGPSAPSGATGNYLVNVTAGVSPNYGITFKPDIGANTPNHTVNTLILTLLDCSGNALDIVSGPNGTAGGITTQGNGGPTGTWLVNNATLPYYTSQESFPQGPGFGGALGTVGSQFTGNAKLAGVGPAVAYTATAAADSSFVLAGQSGAFWNMPGTVAIAGAQACPNAGIPEPGTLALLIPGLAPFGFMLRRRRTIGS